MISLSNVCTSTEGPMIRELCLHDDLINLKIPIRYMISHICFNVWCNALYYLLHK